MKLIEKYLSRSDIYSIKTIVSKYLFFDKQDQYTYNILCNDICNYIINKQKLIIYQYLQYYCALIIINTNNTNDIKIYLYNKNPKKLITYYDILNNITVNSENNSLEIYYDKDYTKKIKFIYNSRKIIVKNNYKKYYSSITFNITCKILNSYIKYIYFYFNFLIYNKLKNKNKNNFNYIFVKNINNVIYKNIAVFI